MMQRFSGIYPSNPLLTFVGTGVRWVYIKFLKQGRFKIQGNYYITNVRAFPLLFARPVRPIRCT